MPNDERIPLSRHALFWCLAVAGCAVDLATKSWVFAQPNLFHGSEWWLWEGHVGIQKSLNEGALFGVGQGKVWIFAVFSIVAAIAIPVWLFVFRAARDRWLMITLAAVLGGVLGNLYDRLGLPALSWHEFHANRGAERVYAVRDWILLQWNDQWVWPNFNVADMLLVCGAASLFLHSILNTPSAAESSERACD